MWWPAWGQATANLYITANAGKITISGLHILTKFLIKNFTVNK